MNDAAALIAAALAVREQAYAPYSQYQVGAALRSANGRVFSGCNVENASYGLSLCAERSAVFAAVAGGVREIETVVVATDNGGTPCGACRQVLAEFAPKSGAPLAILLVDKHGALVRETTLADLLPDAFFYPPPRPLPEAERGRKSSVSPKASQSSKASTPPLRFGEGAGGG